MSDNCPYCGLHLVQEGCACNSVQREPPPERPMPDVPHEAHKAMCDNYVARITTLERELAEAKAENARILAIGKQFEQDARKHFDQGCQNLRRAEEAQSQLTAANATIAELREQLHQSHEVTRKSVESVQRWVEEGKRLNATIAACKEAGFIDAEGRVRKVGGTLPITADGAIAGVGAELWADFNTAGINAPMQCAGPAMPCVPLARLYLDRDAAAAAKEAQ